MQSSNPERYSQCDEARRSYTARGSFFFVVALCVLVVAAPDVVSAQQVADTAFTPPIASPAFPQGKGPVVLIDEGHFNFHTATGRYLPFATLLRRDGYVVRGSAAKFTPEALRAGQVLVISNALNKANESDWNAPHPSAFDSAEIAAVRDWVAGGGSLLLIADHMPFAGAAQELGTALGVTFANGYAVVPNAPGVMVFRKSDGSLKQHAITEGIDSVATFTGSAFQFTGKGEPLLIFGPDVVSMAGPGDPKPVSVAGRLQGGVLSLGKGRVAVFGEAAMFSAQLAGPQKRPMGMNHPLAKQNPQFLLNVMRWLAGGSR